jgi:predicted nucleotidyltransferase
MSLGEFDIDSIKETLQAWGAKTPCIRKIHVFGSRARSDYRSDSDLDISIEIDPLAGYESSVLTWIGEAEHWREQLEPRFPVKLDLELLDGEETPRISAGVRRSSIVVYERET